jgi:uncharacterized OB-fold protein
MYLQRYGLTLEDYPTSSAKDEVRTMYCPKCGALAEQPKKFCKSCGLKLAEHAQLLEDGEHATAAKKQLRKGTSFLLAGLFATLIQFLIYAGIMASADSDFPAHLRFAIALVLLTGPLLCGITGLTYLIRGGYFKNFQEQALASKIEKLEAQRRKLEAQRSLPSINVKASSITEHTTRELQPVSSNSGKIP